MDPKISVLIPSLNQARFLVKTLGTVAKQQYPRVEVIVADGGSDDRTREVVEAYGGLVTKFISEKDRGQLDGLRRALELATGDIYFWLNADDSVMPGAFCAVAEAFARHPDADFVYSDSYAFHEPTRTLGVSERTSNLDFWTHFLFYRQWCSESIYWRAGITKAAFPLDVSLRVYTDYSFFLPMRYARNCRWIPQRLGAFRSHAAQMSALHRAKGDRERELIKQRMCERLGISPDEYRSLRRRHLARFLICQRLYPKAFSAARFLFRKLTFDCYRRRMARFMFDDWLTVPSNIRSRLGDELCDSASRPENA